MKQNKNQTKATNKIRSFPTPVTPTNVSNSYFIFLYLKNYGCSFFAKLSWKKNFFLKNVLSFLQNIHYLEKKNIFTWKKSFILKFWKKSFILKFFFTEKNFFYREKYIWKCKKYISHLRNTENVCITNKI